MSRCKMFVTKKSKMMARMDAAANLALAITVQDVSIVSNVLIVLSLNVICDHLTLQETGNA